MRLPSRRSDDSDVIRARLRAVLDQSGRAPGWLPDDDLDGPVDAPPARGTWPAAGGGDPAPPVPDPSGAAPLADAQGRHRAPAVEARLSPGRRGVWALCVAGVLAAGVLLLWTWLDRPRVSPLPPPPAGSAAAAARTTAAASPSVGEAAATSSPLVVSVVGLVTHPGLVTLPVGARVADAVAAAGGLLPQADPASLNLAARVADGQQIAVGVPGAAGGPSGASTSGTPAGTAAGPVNLNTATAQDLDALPGIGPVLAQRIIDYRNQRGGFRTVDQLDDVPGIGPALYAKLSTAVTV